MKSFLTIVCLFLATPWQAFGKAYFCKRSELIEQSTAIAVIEMDPPQPAVDPSNPAPIEPYGVRGTTWEYQQQAAVHVKKVLKGTLPKDFTMFGAESFVCAQCPLSKGTFLAFLKKDKQFWVGTNWHLSLRPIDKDMVEWYLSEEQRSPMKPQKLEAVITEIQSIMKSTPAPKPPTPTSTKNHPPSPSP